MEQPVVRHTNVDAAPAGKPNTAGKLRCGIATYASPAARNATARKPPGCLCACYIKSARAALSTQCMTSPYLTEMHTPGPSGLRMLASGGDRDRRSTKA